MHSRLAFQCPRSLVYFNSCPCSSLAHYIHAKHGHGPSADASQNFVDTVVKVAAWQDANAEHFRRQQATSDLSDNGVISGFPEIVKEVLQGTIPVCLESEFSDEIWDTAKILREHEGPWLITFVEAVPEPPLIEPAERWEAARNENRIEVDHLDRLEGYNKLLEGW